ncbi:MAG: tetratricopeptide repeat protein, partial [Myxococcales bacterium]|nr:tetratricopeptide repeat protein [Myxococcales bacterium]
RLERSLAIDMDLHGTDKHPSVAASLHELAGVLQAQGDLGGARARLERSLAIDMDLHGTDKHPDVATTLDGLANIALAEGRVPEAIATFERCLSIREQCFGTTDHYMYAESEVSLAMVFLEHGRQEDAMSRLGHAFAVLRDHVPSHPILKHFASMAAPPSLTDAHAQWKQAGASPEQFAPLLNFACNLVVRAARGDDPTQRRALARELALVAAEPEPLPGVRPFLSLLQHRLSGEASPDAVTAWQDALTPNFAGALAKVEELIAEGLAS